MKQTDLIKLKFKEEYSENKDVYIANGKTIAPSPIPSPSPKDNIYDPAFERLWNQLYKRKGSKHKAHQIFQKVWKYFGMDLEDIAGLEHS